MARLSSHFDLQDARFSTVIVECVQPLTIAADSNQTLTGAQLLCGLILRSGMTAARTDTLPSAAALCEAIQGCMVNHSISVRFRNVNATAQTYTIAVGAGGTLATGNGNTAAQNNDRVLRIILTNVTIGQEAYTVYSTGGGTFN